MIYAIWKDVNDRNVAGVKDLVGFFDGTYEGATALVEKMNAEDAEVKKQVEYNGHVRYGFWAQDIPQLSLNNYRESILTE